MSWVSKTIYPESIGVSFQEMIQLNDGTILVVGGEHLGATGTGNPATDDTLNPHCYIYDPIGDIWTLTGSLNTGRVTPVLVKLNNGKILCVGGRSKITDGASLTSCELYDPSTSLWTNTGSLAVGRYRFGLWKLNSGDILVAGGLTGNPGFDSVGSTELYSVAGGTWSNTGHNLLHNTSEPYFFSLSNGTPVIAGGINNTSGGYIGGVDGSYTYDSTTGWASLTSGPVGVHSSDTGRILTLTNGDYMLVGAASNVAGGTLNDSLTYTAIFHVGTNLWEIVGNLNTARQDAVLVATTNAGAIIVQGFTTPYNAVNSAELYDPIGKTWSFNAGDNLPQTQTFASYVQISGGVYVVGGWDVSANPSVVTLRYNEFLAVGNNNFVKNLSDSITLSDSKHFTTTKMLNDFIFKIDDFVGAVTATTLSDSITIGDWLSINRQPPRSDFGD